MQSLPLPHLLHLRWTRTPCPPLSSLPSPEVALTYRGGGDPSLPAVTPGGSRSSSGGSFTAAHPVHSLARHPSASPKAPTTVKGAAREQLRRRFRVPARLVSPPKAASAPRRTHLIETPSGGRLRRAACAGERERGGADGLWAGPRGGPEAVGCVAARGCRGSRFCMALRFGVGEGVGRQLALR